MTILLAMVCSIECCTLEIAIEKAIKKGLQKLYISRKEIKKPEGFLAEDFLKSLKVNQLVILEAARSIYVKRKIKCALQDWEGRLLERTRRDSDE